MQVKFNWNIIFAAMQFELVAALKENCPTHDGSLKQSINAKISNEVLSIYMLNYAMYVEKGTAPHFAPIDALKKWARDKLGDEKLAYALQKHISLYGCFFGNSHRYKVLTKKGYKSLKDINIGDEVLTHKKRWKKVENKPIHKIYNKINRYTIETETGKKVTVTGEHPFYCKRNGKFKWVQAKNLSENDIIQEVI
jgi:hypothetical protein